MDENLWDKWQRFLWANCLSCHTTHSTKALKVVYNVVEITSTCHGSRIPRVAVEKIPTHQREDSGVIVEKIQKVNELSIKILAIYLQQ